MSIDLDDEILQDFLVEAGEILEQLNEQLVDLEQNPDDQNLLNAVFRGFHTVKGGAGFLGLTALVDVCHQAEDVFNSLRTGELTADASMMDVILRAVDSVNGMFTEIQSGQAITPANPELIEQLKAILSGSAAAPAKLDESARDTTAEENISDEEFDSIVDSLSSPATAAEVEDAVVGGNDISDDEFEKLLDALHGEGKAPQTAENTKGTEPSAAAKTTTSQGAMGADEISEDEFDAILDNLHGSGKAPVGNKTAVSQASGGDISENEFEDLLDQIHGKGRSPGKSVASDQVPAKPKSSVTPKTDPPCGGKTC